MKVLVTGGGGFLGKVIVRKLIARGQEAVVIARGDYPELAEMGASLHRGDIADSGAVTRAAKGAEAIIHVAAKAGIWGSFQQFNQANVVGTENVIAACRELGINKLVYTSSPSVAYGVEGAQGADESIGYPPSWGSHYSATKARAEQAVIAANSPELATCCLRPHLIWGPEDNHLVPRIVARAKSGRLKIIGDGKNLIDTIYVDNAADAHLAALERLAPGAACAGKVYFLSQDQPLPVADVINAIVGAAGLPPIEKHVSPGLAAAVGAVLEVVYKSLAIKNEPPMTRFLAHQLSAPHWFDISAAKRDLGYRPAISFDEGIKKLAAWFDQSK